MTDEPPRVVVETPSSEGDGDAARRGLAPTAPYPDAPGPPPPRRGNTRRFVLAALLVAGALVTAATLALQNAQKQKAKIGTQPPPSAATAPALVPVCPEGMVTVGTGAGRAFCIDRTEVTVEAYRPCADAQVCPPPGQRTEGSAIAQGERDVIDPLCTARAPEARAKHPLNCASWDMAAAFCAARGKRLPTEAEWGRAAFGASGDQGKAPWGSAPASAKLLNGCGDECVEWGKKSGVDVKPLYGGSDGFPTTAPVGSFPAGASASGALDLFGNVAEWTADTGDAADTRVVRGGGWQMPSLDLPSTRSVESAARRSVLIGFRCASTPR